MFSHAVEQPKVLHPEPGVINERTILSAVEEERALCETAAKARANAASASGGSKEDIAAILGGSIVWPELRLSELDELSLSFRSIEQLQHLDGLTNLRILRLDNNAISKIDGLSHLTRLEWLDLSFNNIERIENLESLTNLTDLALANNGIRKVEGLSNLTKLEVLTLGNNEISSFSSLTHLRRLPSLRVLSMAGNPASEEEVDSRGAILARLPKLMWLDYARVTDAERKAASDSHAQLSEALRVDEEKLESAQMAAKVREKARTMLETMGLHFIGELWSRMTGETGFDIMHPAEIDRDPKEKRPMEEGGEEGKEGEEVDGGDEDAGEAAAGAGRSNEADAAARAGEDNGDDDEDEEVWGEDEEGDAATVTRHRLLRVPGVKRIWRAYREAVGTRMREGLVEGMENGKKVKEEESSVDAALSRTRGETDQKARKSVRAFLRHVKHLTRQLDEAVAERETAEEEDEEEGDRGAALSTSDAVAMIEEARESNNGLREDLLVQELTLHEACVAIISAFETRYMELAGRRREVADRIFRHIEDEEQSFGEKCRQHVLHLVERAAEGKPLVFSRSDVPLDSVRTPALRAQLRRSKGAAQTEETSPAQLGSEEESGVETQQEAEIRLTLEDMHEDLVALLEDKDVAEAAVAAAGDARVERLFAIVDEFKAWDAKQQTDAVEGRRNEEMQRDRERVEEIGALWARNRHDLDALAALDE